MVAKYNPNISRNWQIRFLTSFNLLGITFNSKSAFLYSLFRIYRDFRIWFCGYELQTPNSDFEIQNPKSSKQKRTSWNFTRVLGRLLDKLSHVSSTVTTITVTVSVANTTIWRLTAARSAMDAVNNMKPLLSVWPMLRKGWTIGYGGVGWHCSGRKISIMLASVSIFFLLLLICG